MFNEWPYGRVAAGCRRYARYVNGIRNVAAMIHRQPAPARGWPPLDVWNTNIQRVALRPCGGRLPPLHPVCKRYAQCSGDDPSPASTGEGLAPVGCYEYECSTSGLTADWRQVCRRYIRYVQRYTQCSGDDSSPASTGEGLAPLDVWNTNIQRVALRPMAADCRRYIRYV